MMKTKLLLLSFLFITMGLTNVHAQSNSYRDTVDARVYFRQGQSRIDLSYRSNRANLKAFTDRLREAFNDPNQRVGVVRIVGGASPEGRTDFNKALSADRAASVEMWLRNNLPYPVSYETSSVGIDWEGLTKLVEAATNMPYRYEVLHILKNTPEWIRDSRTNEIVDGRKRRLGMLAGGNAWRWMEDHLFEELRSGGMGMSCEIIYINPPAHMADKDTVYVHDTLRYYYKETVTQTDTIYLGKQKVDKRAQRAAWRNNKRAQAAQDRRRAAELAAQREAELAAQREADRQRAAELAAQREADRYNNQQRAASMASQRYAERDARRAAALENKKPSYMSLKTNLLYDAALVPNVALEVSLGRRWSIGVGGFFAWWTIEQNNFFWRIYGGEVNVRKYLGWRALEKPLTGHHIGVYGHTESYDFMTGGTRGYMSDGNNWAWSGGVEYGYTAPIGRRLNLDFTIGFGYLESRYNTYTSEVDSSTGVRNYYWEDTRLGRWMGPTKAEISLIWLIGHGNYNKR